MKTEQTYTTGNAGGITRIPLPTIRRYIHLFPDSFTPESKIPTKGRRFTQSDIQRLMLIRKLFRAGKSQTDIQTALQEFTPENTPLDETIELLTEARTQAQQALVFSREIRKRTESSLNSANYFMQTFREVITQAKQIPTLKAELETLKQDNQILHEELNQIKERLGIKPKQKKGFLSW